MAKLGILQATSLAKPHVEACTAESDLHTMPPPHDKLLTKPIIIIGAPRSGTTRLGALLAKHPLVAYLEEPRLIWRYGNDGKSDRLLPGDARCDVVSHIRNSFRTAVSIAGKERLLEKTPSNSLRLGFLDRVFPDCVFIHIIRNGLESTLAIKSFWERNSHGFSGLAPGRIGQRLKEVSLRRIPYYITEIARRASPKSLSGILGANVWGPRIPGISRLIQELTLTEVCALQWRTCVELACIEGRQLPSGRYYECRMEDLSPQLIEEIFLFCGLEPCVKFSTGDMALYDREKARKRIARADPGELSIIRPWIEPTTSWLGYQDIFEG
jgi:hypothetical protein